MGVFVFLLDAVHQGSQAFLSARKEYVGSLAFQHASSDVHGVEHKSFVICVIMRSHQHRTGGRLTQDRVQMILFQACTKEKSVFFKPPNSPLPIHPQGLSIGVPYGRSKEPEAGLANVHSCGKSWPVLAGGIISQQRDMDGVLEQSHDPRVSVGFLAVRSLGVRVVVENLYHIAILASMVFGFAVKNMDDKTDQVLAGGPNLVPQAGKHERRDQRGKFAPMHKPLTMGVKQIRRRGHHRIAHQKFMIRKTALGLDVIGQVQHAINEQLHSETGDGVRLEVPHTVVCRTQPKKDRFHHGISCCCCCRRGEEGRTLETFEITCETKSTNFGRLSGSQFFHLVPEQTLLDRIQCLSKRTKQERDPRQTGAPFVPFHIEPQQLSYRKIESPCRPGIDSFGIYMTARRNRMEQFHMKRIGFRCTHVTDAETGPAVSQRWSNISFRFLVEGSVSSPRLWIGNGSSVQGLLLLFLLCFVAAAISVSSIGCLLASSSSFFLFHSDTTTTVFLFFLLFQGNSWTLPLHQLCYPKVAEAYRKSWPFSTKHPTMCFFNPPCAVLELPPVP